MSRNADGWSDHDIDRHYEDLDPANEEVEEMNPEHTHRSSGPPVPVPTVTLIILGKETGYPTYMPCAFRAVKSCHVPRQGDRVVMDVHGILCDVMSPPAWSYDMSTVEIQTNAVPIDDHDMLMPGWYSSIHAALQSLGK